MHVGMAWIRPWLIALEGKYIRSNLIWWYACYYIRDDFMYVGVAWVRLWLIRSTLIWWYACYYIRDDFIYVSEGLDTSLCDCSGRRVHKIDPYMVVCMRVDFMYFT